jgi:hypothetical protein
MYKCSLCKFETSSRKQIRNHIKEKHKEKWRDSKLPENETKKSRHEPLTAFYKKEE